MTILEKELEAKLVKGVKQMGGQCLKWTSPGTTGLPDRIILLPGGLIAFVEMKRPKNSKTAQLQTYWHRVLIKLGFKAYIASTEQSVQAVLNWLRDELDRQEAKP